MSKVSKKILCLVLFLGLVWLIACLCAQYAPHNPIEINLLERLKPPDHKHIFGTDELGRDIFSRVLVGFSNTINVSIMTLFSSFFLGVIIGSFAGLFFGTFVDRAFNWIAAMLFSLPFLLILAAVMSLLEKNLFNAYLVMTFIIWVSPARIVRTGVINAVSAPFVLTERAMGMGQGQILLRSLLPKSIEPALIFSFRYFPEIIGLEAGLSFLGLGIQPPQPGLGKMIFDSINYIYSAWWYAFFPAFFLFLIVCIINIFYRAVAGKVGGISR